MTSGSPQVVSPEATVISAAEAVLGRAPAWLGRLDGGMNNALYRVDVGGRALVAKVYFQHPSDPRDRLGTEFLMLSFLWDQGVRCIPEPVAMDPSHGVGFYGYIEGTRLSPSSVTERDLAEYAQFALNLWRLTPVSGVNTLPSASEAAFTLGDRLATVARRLTWLQEALDPGALQARSFLTAEAGPLLERLGRWAADEAESAGVATDEPVPEEERALSQGDIGLHNCLRTDNGLIFIDFEYGGWDDVAQIMVQTCLAPAVPVAERLHPRLLGAFVDQAGPSNPLALRVRLYYPVLALKWGLIMLNELIQVGRARRTFAGTAVDEVEESRVCKARNMVEVAKRSIDEPLRLSGASNG